MGICLSLFGAYLYSYLETQNRLTKIKIEIPEMEREIQLLKEENKRLVYQINQFENPSHLIELVHRPEFSHLKHPILKEILTVPEAFASNE